MDWLYICEMPELSLYLLKERFNFLEDFDLGNMNASDGPKIIISPDDEKFLFLRNELDYEIYAYAVSLQIKRAARLVHSKKRA